LVTASDNPFGVDIIDCAAVTQSFVSTTKDPQIAESFVQLRTSTGEQYRGHNPEGGRTVTCDLSYPYSRRLSDGPLFKAQEMEDKWDVYLYDSDAYFARSWRGELVYRARVHREPDRLRVYEVAYPADQDAVYALRVVDFLIKSHVFDQVVPHPLPSDLALEPAQIALYSFSLFGRRCAYASFEDTTAVPAPAPHTPST